MSDSRSRTRSVMRERSVSRRGVWVIIIAALAVLVAVATAVGVVRTRPITSSAAPMSAESAPASIPVQPLASVQPQTVEVPDVIGMPYVDASVVLKAAGFAVVAHSTEGTAPTGDVAGLVIAAQDPSAGVLVDAGSGVTLTLGRAEPRRPAPDREQRDRWIVCIDPGHQERGDSTPEPIGPGSRTTKPRVTGGATGVETGIPEYELALQISMNLKARLEAKGVKVVMTRTTNDVNLSNSQRAQRANKAGADLFVRIHCDGSPDAEVSGVSTLFPARNTWTKGFASASKNAATLVHASVVRSTGAVNRHTKSRADLSGFNWSKVPCLLVECGFLSNPVEDRLLASPHYQDKVASGIAEGVTAYLKESDR